MFRFCLLGEGPLKMEFKRVKKLEKFKIIYKPPAPARRPTLQEVQVQVQARVRAADVQLSAALFFIFVRPV